MVLSPPDRTSGRRSSTLGGLFLALAGFLPALMNVHAEGRVEFNRDIRPLLADACFRCHGFDSNARKAGLRLDARPEALKPASSGKIAIVPGHPEQSELLHRILAEDPDERMPPADAPKPLTVQQKELVRRWIAEGAEYQDHWAFLKPVARALPKVKQIAWPRNPIDHFILAQLEASGLTPDREANRASLLRRVSLDLTGLPPTPSETAAFLADHSPDAFTVVVDRLLASPRYGERMAQDWLDAARFADSNGYQVDRDREMWAWRDWVVHAFNRNLPFDQFTIEQLAGDLLPNPSLDQRIATGFHRNHMINEEGGIIAEEFLNEYCADRVETTGVVWLGLTLNCARCHDHKYDPVTQKDFYGLYAFFHNVPENGVGNYSASIRRNTPPFLKLPAPEAEQQLAALQRELTNANAQLDALTAQVLAQESQWAIRARENPPRWIAPGLRHLPAPPASPEPPPAQADPARNPPATPTRRVVVSARAALPRVTALRLEFSRGANSLGEKDLKAGISEIRVFSEDPAKPAKQKLTAAAARDTLPSAEIARALDGKPDTAWTASLPEEGAVAGVLEWSGPASPSGEVAFTLELDLAPLETSAPWRLRVAVTDAESDFLMPVEIARIFDKPSGERNPTEQEQLNQFRLSRAPEHAALAQKAAGLRQKIDEIDLSIPITLVMSEMAEPRPTHVLKRGAYDKPGEQVHPSTPLNLLPFPADAPRNRLGLARWLVDPDNPLTARVAVNRLWQSVFGTGLVRTSEDFGTQGERPSHPELLDWLAREFIRTGWDVKRMMKLFVTSAAYRQDSNSTPARRAFDPENRLIARGPRFRLPAETIRDQALAVSGLLVGRVGGPSVKPYHPPGLYEQVVAGSSASTYEQGHGADLYRRTLYTYWKRSVPNPALLLFDMPFRETCAVRRARTTTPLQALNLLNDPTFVEASAFLARRMILEGGATVESRVEYGFRLTLGRPPLPAELQVLADGWKRRESAFRARPDSASQLLGVGDAKTPWAGDPVELAAYATVATVLLNLDETLTKE